MGFGNIIITQRPIRLATGICGCGPNIPMVMLYTRVQLFALYPCYQSSLGANPSAVVTTRSRTAGDLKSIATDSQDVIVG